MEIIKSYTNEWIVAMNSADGGDGADGGDDAGGGSAVRRTRFRVLSKCF